MKNITKKISALALSTAILFTSVTSASAANYTVQRGDTLFKIALNHGTTYQTIMELNNLTSSSIFAGQVLQVDGSPKAIATPEKAFTTPKTDVINIAKKYLGTRYVFGGKSPAGFDCSGFIYYVMKQSGKSIARTNAESYYSKSKRVSAPQIGDLVFFSNTYKAGISHVGIYIGNGKMISASGSKVQIEPIKSGYWKKYFTGYGRI